MRKQTHEEKKGISLPLDSRNRICLSQFIPKDLEVSSYKAYQDGDKIILEPMAEVSAREAWLYSNPKALAMVLEGIKQADEGKVRKLDIDFSEFDEDEDGV